MHRFTCSLGLLIALVFCVVVLPAANAQGNATAYAYIDSEDPLLPQFAAYSEDLADYAPKQFRVLTTVGTFGLRSPQFISTALRLGGGSDSVAGQFGEYALASSANYARLDRAGDALYVNRATGGIVRVPFGGSAVIMPQPPGTLLLPDTQPHWPFLALSAGRPLATSEYTFTAQTTAGLFQFAAGQYYQLDPSSGAEAFAVADDGYIAGMNGAHQATIWLYGSEQHFNLFGASKALSVNEYGTAVGFSTYTGRQPRLYQAWIGQYGSTAVKLIPNMDVALAINNSGQVIGLQYIGGNAALPTAYEGVVYNQFTGQTVGIRTLYTPANVMTNVIPTAINDHGEITYYAMRNSNPVSGILTPTQEINVWWIKDGQGVSRQSNQPFQFSLPETIGSGDEPALSYSGSYALNGNFAASLDPQNQMTTQYAYGTSFKEYYVDIFNLTYYGGTYTPNTTEYVTYIARSPSGAILDEDTSRFYYY